LFLHCSLNFPTLFRYVKSRNDLQLLHGLGYNDTSACKPLESSHNLPVVPCGLIAWSLFNDTYKFSRGPLELKVNRKNIAWKSDREHKFGKHVYPFNFQNGTLIGGGKLDPSIPVSLKLLNCILSFFYRHHVLLWPSSLFRFEISFCDLHYNAFSFYSYIWQNSLGVKKIGLVAHSGHLTIIILQIWFLHFFLHKFDSFLL